MVERNNHGHATIAELRRREIRVLRGHDSKHGWLSSTMGKVRLYDAVADAIRNQEIKISDLGTVNQLASIEGGTLRAPEGLNEDLADACALGIVALPQCNRGLGEIWMG